MGTVPVCLHGLGLSGVMPAGRKHAPYGTCLKPHAVGYQPLHGRQRCAAADQSVVWCTSAITDTKDIL